MRAAKNGASATAKSPRNSPEDQTLTDKFKVSEVELRNSFGLTRNDTILSLELRGNVSTWPRFAPFYRDKAGDTFPSIYDCVDAPGDRPGPRALSPRAVALHPALSGRAAHRRSRRQYDGAVLRSRVAGTSRSLSPLPCTVSHQRIVPSRSRRTW
jgi:hypothetical protein